MNTELNRIAKLIERNWNGPMWHGTNLSEVLKDVTWEKAYAKPLNASHNIYEYVRHMSTWRRWAVEQLKGHAEYKVEINSPQDWAVDYEATEANWQNALQELEALNSDLLSNLNSITDEKLDELVPERKFKWYVMLHGVVHHDIYHSAQISLLKKLNG